MPGFKTFVVGEMFEAEDANNYLMKQSVIQCTSATRPSSPHEGMTIYETDTDRIFTYENAAWLWYHSSFLQALKTSDEIVNNSTTLQDDNQLLVTVASSVTYELYGLLRFKSPAAADLKFQFTKPTGTTFTISCASTVSPASSVDCDLQILLDSDASVVIEGNGTGTTFSVVLGGTVTTSSTAGAFTLQWAQNTMTVGDTTMQTLSYLTLRRIS